MHVSHQACPVLSDLERLASLHESTGCDNIMSCFDYEGLVMPSACKNSQVGYLWPLIHLMCPPMQGGAHHKHARVREVAIHISNYTMRREDRGSVVVGGSIEMGDLTGWLRPPSLTDMSLCVKLHLSCSSPNACMAAFTPVTASLAELDRICLLPTRL